jgi:2-polyprenyl-3-methyl-5-hydroxy-6-metoxy-1,4-benzoquinol methylase
MRHLTIDERWPASWKDSYWYDREEVFGSISDFGYAYAYSNRGNATLGLLQEALPPGATVLDIAAAQGNFSLRLAELGYLVTWNDLREDLVEYVRLKYERGSITFAPGNAFDLQFPSEFDAVLVTEIIEHVAHPDEFLRKVAKLVKINGYVVMTTPNGGYFRNDLPRFSDCDDPGAFESIQFRPGSSGHIFLLYRDEIERLAAAAGMIVDKLMLITNPLTAGHLKTGSLLQLLPRKIVDGLEAVSQKLPVSVCDRVMTQFVVRLKKA